MVGGWRRSAGKGTMNQPSGPDLDDPYAELPELYDLEHAGLTEDIDLYLRLAEVVGDPILELGCGTGRVLGPLAAAGNRITGVLKRCSAARGRCCASLPDRSRSASRSSRA
jgi:SAM-dependent methyltransferase